MTELSDILRRLEALEARRDKTEKLPSVVIYEGVQGGDRLTTEAKAAFAGATVLILPAGRSAATGAYHDDPRIEQHRKFFKKMAT